MARKIVTPTKRGYLTIPPDVRKKLNINSRTKFNVYVEDNKLVFAPVSPADVKARDLEAEGRDKGYISDDVEIQKIFESNKMNIVQRSFHRTFS